MPKISFHFAGTNTPQTVEAKVGESVLQVALRAQIPMEHACGGFASCGTCHIKVKTGMAGLSLKSSDEQNILKYESKASDSSRLACQTKVQEDAAIEVINLGREFAIRKTG